MGDDLSTLAVFDWNKFTLYCLLDISPHVSKVSRGGQKLTSLFPQGVKDNLVHDYVDFQIVLSHNEVSTDIWLKIKIFTRYT